MSRAFRLVAIAAALGVGGYFVGAMGAPNPAVSARTALLEDGVSFQAAILADGVVTMDEYESSVLANIACLEAVGLEVVEEPRFDDHRQVFDYQIVLTQSEDDDLKEAEAAYERCHREYERDVAMAWAAAADTSHFEEEVERLTKQCLVDTDLGSDFADLVKKDIAGELSREDSEQLSNCRSEAIVTASDG